MAKSPASTLVGTRTHACPDCGYCDSSSHLVACPNCGCPPEPSVDQTRPLQPVPPAVVPAQSAQEVGGRTPASRGSRPPRVGHGKIMGFYRVAGPKGNLWVEASSVKDALATYRHAGALSRPGDEIECVSRQPHASLRVGAEYWVWQGSGRNRKVVRRRYDKR